MTPPLCSLYGILYHISNVYYKFDMNPQTRVMYPYVAFTHDQPTMSPCLANSNILIIAT